MFARTFAESGSNAIAVLDLDQALAEEAAADIEKWLVNHGSSGLSWSVPGLTRRRASGAA
jgi:hypothetical protein